MPAVCLGCRRPLPAPSRERDDGTLSITLDDAREAVRSARSEAAPEDRRLMDRMFCRTCGRVL